MSRRRQGGLEILPSRDLWNIPKGLVPLFVPQKNQKHNTWEFNGSSSELLELSSEKIKPDVSYAGEETPNLDERSFATKIMFWIKVLSSKLKKYLMMQTLSPQKCFFAFLGSEGLNAKRMWGI